MPRKARDPEEWWWEHVSVDGPLADLRPDLGQCWLWAGGVNADGYPMMWDGKRNTLAYRVGWMIACGVPVPARLRLRHFACTRRLCVNPGHIRPDAAVENVLGTRNAAAWNMRQKLSGGGCWVGHLFTHENSIDVPGGIACRACRKEVEQSRAASPKPLPVRRAGTVSASTS